MAAFQSKQNMSILGSICVSCYFQCGEYMHYNKIIIIIILKEMIHVLGQLYYAI